MTVLQILYAVAAGVGLLALIFVLAWLASLVTPDEHDDDQDRGGHG